MTALAVLVLTQKRYDEHVCSTKAKKILLSTACLHHVSMRRLSTITENQAKYQCPYMYHWSSKINFINMWALLLLAPSRAR